MPHYERESFAEYFERENHDKKGRTMKTIVSIVVFAALLTVTPRACFALWDVMIVSPKEAKELGLLVRTTGSDQGYVSVALEFSTEGPFKAFGPGGKFQDRALVQLHVGQGDKPQLSASLKEDRSKPGRVIVGFSADRAQFDQCQLSVYAPYTDGGLGGAVYELRIKDFFVEPKKDR